MRELEYDTNSCPEPFLLHSVGTRRVEVVAEAQKTSLRILKSNTGSVQARRRGVSRAALERSGTPRSPRSHHVYTSKNHGARP